MPKQTLGSRWPASNQQLLKRRPSELQLSDSRHVPSHRRVLIRAEWMTAQWQRSDPAAPFNHNDSTDVKSGLEGSHTVSKYFTLRFLCGRLSGWGGGLGPGLDGRPVVTWSGGRTFLHQPRRTQVVHWSTLVLQRGGGEVWREGTWRQKILGIDQCNEIHLNTPPPPSLIPPQWCGGVQW